MLEVGNHGNTVDATICRFGQLCKSHEGCVHLLEDESLIMNGILSPSFRIKNNSKELTAKKFSQENLKDYENKEMFC